MKLTLSLLLACLSFANNSFAQQPLWDTYLIEENGIPSSTIVDMNLLAQAPMSGIGFLIKAGVNIKDCDSNGFPTLEELEKLYAQQEDMLIHLSELTDNVHAGTVMKSCMTQDYIYIADTPGIQIKIKAFYAQKYPAYESVVSVEVDENWAIYTDKIYPDPETQEVMANQKVLDQLIGEGDKLTTPRRVDHWLFFADKANRKLFKKWAEENGYTIESEYLDEDQIELPFALSMHRLDAVDISTINRITLELKREATKLSGFYDGWETVAEK